MFCDALLVLGCDIAQLCSLHATRCGLRPTLGRWKLQCALCANVSWPLRVLCAGKTNSSAFYVPGRNYRAIFFAFASFIGKRARYQHSRSALQCANASWSCCACAMYRCWQRAHRNKHDLAACAVYDRGMTYLNARCRCVVLCFF